MPSPLDDVLPLRSFDELRADVGRRAVQLRRRRMMVRLAPAVAVVLATLAVVNVVSWSDVAVRTVPPAGQEPDDPSATDERASGEATPSEPGIERPGGQGPSSPSHSQSESQPSSGPSGETPPGTSRPTTVAATGTIVFSSDRSGSYQVYVTPLAGGPARALTNDRGGARRPAVSPDGTHIAYESNDIANPVIRVIRSDGTGARTIPVDGASRPVWSPDGRQIAFQRDLGIWVAPVDGTPARRLTGTREDSADLDPAWSPDGTELAFSRFYTDSTADLMVMGADGSQLRPIHRGLTGAPAWSPSGADIAFVDLSGARGRIAVVGEDGQRYRALTDVQAWSGRPAWLLDGSAIVFDRDSDGHTPPGCRVGFHDGRAVNACYPTGDGPALSELWTVQADGSGVRQLRTSSANEVEPTFGRFDS